MRENNITALVSAAGTRLNFDYTNYRGEHARRDAITRTLWYGTSAFFPSEPEQWYLTCTDVERNAVRDFRCAGMRNVVAV